MIPKKIHYCWFGPKPLPVLVLKCLKTWKEQLPDYDVYLWNEENSPMQIPFVQQAYSSKKYAFVSDYVRFWALFNEGGIYLDTDMFVIKSFNDLINNSVFFGWENDKKNAIGCCVVGSERLNRFTKNILEKYETLSFHVDLIPVLVIPGIVSKCYSEYNLKHEITIYPFEYFYPFPYEEKENVTSFMQYKTESTYAIHLWNVSWGTFKDKLRDKILYYLRIVWRKIR